MALSPVASPQPKVATPLAHRKRRHSALDKGVIDLTGDGDEDAAAAPMGATDGHVTAAKSTNGDHRPTLPRKLEDDAEEADDDNQSLIDDMLDTAELEPYSNDTPDNDDCLDARIVSGLHARLRKVGPEAFVDEFLTKASIPPVLLGTAFGLHPQIWEIYGEKFYVDLLVKAIVRACYKRQKLVQYNTINDAAALLRDRKNIMVITGAGISTSLGIPDFRSKETGFYSKLVEMGINEPEIVFDIEEFDLDPRTFYTLAADILPDLKHYSPTHAFIRLLQDKGKLQTNYTQNIDNLEELAGIEKERLIQCHGSFAGATCRKCKHKVPGADIFADIRAKRVSYCKPCKLQIAAAQAAPKPKKRKPMPQRRHSSSSDDDMDDDIPQPGVMKPDITFFGEQLPNDFFTTFTDRDANSVDLVVVIGTSLKVAPVSEMPNYLPKDIPHIYISRDPVEHVNFDIQLLGSCDDVVVDLCRRAGWELTHEMIPTGFKVAVEAVEDSEHRWKIKHVGGEVCGNGTEAAAVAAKST
ncbi:NAD-dependent histone deacetylase sir2 [Extremus antarcticus]|uniref:NAD-dependent histone deacetylase sir2 n=1 Tax=Extremus antarcticus TaxID=702011 RepID=A0AAJ0G7X6_9PEZI|nr:NAD-dependent histone deacetylase sir2 [Extremus antarcticus]